MKRLASSGASSENIAGRVLVVSVSYTLRDMNVDNAVVLAETPFSA